MTETKFYRIGKAALMLGVSPDSLKRYEREGIVTFERRANIRYVTPEQIQFLDEHRKRIRRKFIPVNQTTRRIALIRPTTDVAQKSE